jgi:catechol 2,3-dioxygenase-like lactoylglutathione lyase family enzyme
MTDPICKAADIVFVRFELADLDTQKEYLQHFGMQPAHEADGTIYFKGTGADPFIYVATKGAQNRYLSSGYRVKARSDLENLAAHFGVDITKSMEPGGGEKVTLTDPDGLGVEVFYGMARGDAPTQHAPALNAGFDKPRKNELQRFGKGADEWQSRDGKLVYELTSKVMRLGHTAINVADSKRSMDWYADTLGFLVSDNIVLPDGMLMGGFMRCDLGATPADHHTINITALPPEKLETHGSFGHAGFELTESVDDLMAGHFHMKTVGKYAHEWGIGRHLLGSQMYDYWRDPAGFILEHWTDGDLLDASVPPVDASARDAILAQYGPVVPPSFNLSMSSEKAEEVCKTDPSISTLFL